MAVTRRYYGINYGADRSTITESASTTSKDVEIVINQGNAAGTTAEQQQRAAYLARENVITQLRELVEQLEHSATRHPAPTS
jgi:hypothetical protein